MMIRFLALWTLLAAVSTVSADGLEGDAEALKRVESMLSAMGGREVWAKAKSLYTMERARHPTYGEGIIASFWRDLEQPGEYAKLSIGDFDIVYGWDEDNGWISRGGELRDFKDAEMEERRFYWHREVYTLYHQLAKGERDLTVKSTERNGFVVMDESNNKIGEFRLTPEGDLYFWSQLGGDKPVAYVYGPHKSFGQMKFPDWGTSTDGGWSSYYVQVKPSEKPFNAHVTLTKPESAWSGGALKRDNCPE